MSCSCWVFVTRALGGTSAPDTLWPVKPPSWFWCQVWPDYYVLYSMIITSTYNEPLKKLHTQVSICVIIVFCVFTVMMRKFIHLSIWIRTWTTSCLICLCAVRGCNFYSPTVIQYSLKVLGRHILSFTTHLLAYFSY